MASLTVRSDGTIATEGTARAHLLDLELAPTTTDQNLELLAGAGHVVTRVTLSPDGARTYHFADEVDEAEVSALESVRGAREALEAADAALVEARGAYLASLAAAAAAGVSYAAIGRVVGVHAATISNQLRRAGLSPEGPA